METKDLWTFKNICVPAIQYIRSSQKKSAQQAEWCGRVVGIVGSMGVALAYFTAPLLAVAERIIRIAANLLGVLLKNKSCSLNHAFNHLKRGFLDGTLHLLMCVVAGCIKSLKFGIQSLINPNKVS